jgi:GTP-binding protein HflX
MREIRKRLEKLRKSRELRRRHRHEAGFFLIAIAGYTNAGKSSLLNLLTEERVKVEEMLFSTLSPTTRKISKRFTVGRPPLLFTDTVGFIRDLPSWVIDAFHSTLEEIAVADLILLMVDLSEPVDRVRTKLQASLRELRDISAESPVILVFNKIDRIEEGERERRLQALDIEKDYVCVSVKERLNIEDLIEAISRNLPSLIEVKVILPLDNQSQSLLSILHERAWIMDIKYSDKIVVHLATSQRMLERLKRLCKQKGGKILTTK